MSDFVPDCEVVLVSKSGTPLHEVPAMKIRGVPCMVITELQSDTTSGYFAITHVGTGGRCSQGSQNVKKLMTAARRAWRALSKEQRKTWNEATTKEEITGADTPDEAVKAFRSVHRK